MIVYIPNASADIPHDVREQFTRGDHELNVNGRLRSTLRGLARERKSGRNGDHYERCTLTVLTNRTVGYANQAMGVRPDAGVQLHGSSGARSSRLVRRDILARLPRMTNRDDLRALTPRLWQPAIA
jgi:hypothetical protein